MAVPSDLTPERVAAVAALLRANDMLTVLSACIDAGVSPGAVRASLKRLRDGTGGEHVAEIARAVDEQCESLLRSGELKAGGDKPTSWYQWRLETKHPSEYGRAQKVELAHDTTSMASKSDAELLAIIHGTAGDE